MHNPIDHPASINNYRLLYKGEEEEGRCVYLLYNGYNNAHIVNVQKPLRELGRLCLSAGEQSNEIVTEVRAEPRAGLPLLQVWPSDSPRGEADGQAQAFVFPDVQENVNDSGIESIQVT